MPCLQLDDGTVLAEVTAIAAYFDETSEGPSLIGETPEERAETRMWNRRLDTRILEPMIPAIKPEILDAKVRRLVETENLQGFLLSGGSNKRNEINYSKFYPVIEGLKRDFPQMRIAIHTALTDRQGAKEMEASGVDVAMLDIIGAEETIREVYHLDRPVDDFEETVAALCETSMQISPHIVIGLHYGRILGEENALDILSRYDTKALVLVVIMPFYAKPGTFVTPDTSDVGHIFLEARRRLPDRQVLLGCARPPGMHKRVTDAYAVMAGLDGIAFPADGAVAVAGITGRPCSRRDIIFLCSGGL